MEQGKSNQAGVQNSGSVVQEVSPNSYAFRSLTQQCNSLSNTLIGRQIRGESIALTTTATCTYALPVYGRNARLASLKIRKVEKCRVELRKRCVPLDRRVLIHALR
ncbi:BQ5605_C039g11796 [Microbotryum silenes-dioicae]|uniref:BQ5605_C039g11796 protein n=1 Tax=Microbotryum silenes-dioicae TaxID=796604 RepID=A0A2X0MJ33_9BASI|nr:BQ5605_C039g11796 [Microbotryum silenes-dioicae]